MAHRKITHDYYAILDVEQTASLPVIKASYYRLAKQTHPDKSADPAATSKFQLLSQAWETINDAGKRREYDLSYPFIRKATRTSSGDAASQDAKTKSRESERSEEVARKIAGIQVLLQKLRSSMASRSARWELRERTLLADIASIKKVIARLEEDIEELNAEADAGDGEETGDLNRLAESLGGMSIEHAEAKSRARQELQVSKVLKERQLDAERTKLAEKETEKSVESDVVSKENASEGLKMHILESALAKAEATRRNHEEDEAAREREDKKRAAEEEARRRRTEDFFESFWRSFMDDQEMPGTKKRQPNERKDQKGFCAHRGWWPKVETGGRCPDCSRSWKYLLECPTCSKLACAKCQKKIRIKMDGY